jgi:undecaprenyl-diphosphatase
MDFWQTVFLGFVQGVAEFLPISSSGHLVLFESLLGSHGSHLTLNVVLHLGTLLSIVVVYWRELWQSATQPRLFAAIVVATLPVVVVGLLFHEELERAFGSPVSAGAALCVTAALMWMTRRLDHGQTTLSEVDLRQALVVGLFQAVAPIPGISRSGATIFGGLLSGMNRQTAATFSFLIAVPAILGAATLETWSALNSGQTEQHPWGRYAAGSLVAFVVGVFALRLLQQIITARRLHAFAWYCLMVGLVTLTSPWWGSWREAAERTLSQ